MIWARMLAYITGTVDQERAEIEPKIAQNPIDRAHSDCSAALRDLLHSAARHTVVMGPTGGERSSLSISAAERMALEHGAARPRDEAAWWGTDAVGRRKIRTVLRTVETPAYACLGVFWQSRSWPK